MSEAQRIIARNFEQICRDVNIPNEGDFGELGELEKSKLYTAIRSFVYEWLCDISTIKDAGLSAQELNEMENAYKPNKYEKRFIN